MKVFGLIAAFCVALALVACGEDSSSGEPGQSETARPTKPDPHFPSGPLPKEVVIKDLEEGSGPGAETGDTLTVHYVGVDKKDKVRYSSWTLRKAPLTFKLGVGPYNFPGWEQGLEGMKAGGRRELFIPANLALGKPLFYIVDLLKLKEDE